MKVKETHQVCHVIPMYDTMSHTLRRCVCKPKIKLEKFGVLFIHHADDCREIVEELTEEISEGQPWTTVYFPL